MKTTEIKQFADLYGPEIILPELNKQFMFVSFCKNSIPKQGSKTVKTKTFKNNFNVNIEKVILHRSRSITVKIKNLGYFQYFN